jgi:uncharacterized protein (TIGR03437 family)
MEAMKPQSSLYLSLKAILLVVVLGVGMRPLAAQQTEAQFIASVNSAIQPLLALAPGKPIIMGGQHEFAHGLAIPNIDLESLLQYADGLKAAGAQRIEFNPGYLSLRDPAVMTKYDALVQHIRQLGLMLAINVEYIPSQQPVTDFQEFQTEAVEGAAEIAARYKPDNFVIVHEPDTMAARMGIQTTVQDWDGFIRAVAPLVRQSSPHTRLGAGCYYAAPAGAAQADADQENAYFQDFATIPDLDFLTMDIYNDNTFGQYQQWAQLAQAQGKGVYIEETWIPHYLTGALPADWESVGLDDLSAIGPTSADFAGLYGPWIHAMALFASTNGMESMTPFTTPAFFQYGTMGADRPEQNTYAKMVVSALANGQLTSAGQANLTYSQELGIKIATSLSSASYATVSSVYCTPASNPCNANSTVAPDELVSAFGQDLGTSRLSTPSASFPASLAGTTATLVDSANKSYAVPLAFVSPVQVNYMVPSEAQPGAATLTITSADGTKTTGVVLISPVDPGLYAANATGQGAAAGFAVCSGTCAGWSERQANGQFVQDLFTCDAGGCTPQPIKLGGASDTVVLELFGTGLRHVASPKAVTATINGLALPVQYAGAQGQFTGEDQLNVQLPYNLAASGKVSLTVTTTVDQNALALFDTEITPSSNVLTIDIE